MTTTYVTTDRWTVGYGTGRHINGVELHVGYYDDSEPNGFGGRGVYHRHDCWGMTFATREEAQRYAYDNGFLKPYKKVPLDDIVSAFGAKNAEWEPFEDGRTLADVVAEWEARKVQS
jgi:hypothetical protein